VAVTATTVRNPASFQPRAHLLRERCRAYFGDEKFAQAQQIYLRVDACHQCAGESSR
jgi:hypothetical protein